MRTYFVNFVADNDQLLGCAIVDVSEIEYPQAMIDEFMETQPKHASDTDEWIPRLLFTVAMKGCGPQSGHRAVIASRIDQMPAESLEPLKNTPRNTFLDSDTDFSKLGCVPVKAIIDTKNHRIKSLEQLDLNAPTPSAWD